MVFYPTKGAKMQFLAHLDPLEFEKGLDPVFRSRVANMLLSVIRDARSRRRELSPSDALAKWCEECQLQINRVIGYRDRTVGDPEQWDSYDEAAIFWSGLLEELRHPEEPVWLYIDLRIRWDALPSIEQEAIKRRSKTGNISPLSERVASDAQKSYLRALGYRGPDPANGQEASDLINEYRKKKGLP